MIPMNRIMPVGRVKYLMPPKENRFTPVTRGNNAPMYIVKDKIESIYAFLSGKNSDEKVTKAFNINGCPMAASI
jgi:hypothetical protein